MRGTSRSLTFALLAMAAGLGIYQYDNALKDTAAAGSTMKLALNSAEILVMGPGLGWMVWQLAERLRQREERHRQRLAEERERRFHLLGRIAASVAHEIRNPLHNLRLINEELHAELPAQATALLVRMDANLQRLDHAIALVYELSRPNTTGDGIELESISVHPLVVEALAETSRRLGREISATLPDPTLAPIVLGREASLRIILGNLVRNAAEAAGQEAITISYRRDGRRWVFTIANPGRLADDVVAGGIPAASAKPDGMGVGLSIARHLTEQLRGSLWFTNGNGQVTTSIALKAADKVDDQ